MRILEYLISICCSEMISFAFLQFLRFHNLWNRAENCNAATKLEWYEC